MEGSKRLVVLFKSNTMNESGDGASGSEPYTELLRLHGFDAVIVEPLAFVFHVQELVDEIERSTDYEGVVLTSTRAVSVFSDALKRCLDPDAKQRWTNNRSIFVVGPRTAEAARKALDSSRVFGEETGNLAQLAKLIVQKMFERGDERFRLLYPTSDVSLGTLAERLNQIGFNKVNLVPVKAYETMMNPQLESRLADVFSVKVQRILVFFSPSGVDNVIEAAGSAKIGLFENTKVIGVGLTTDTALASKGVAREGIMEQPTPEALLQCIQALDV